jgi:hypothetical protein
MDAKEKAAIEAQLAKIKASFAGSRVRTRLLDLLVTYALDERASDLNEYFLAEKVYGLSDFDPAQNARVRQGVRDLRQKLEKYYKGGGRDERCVIEIEGYVPKFRFREEMEPTADRPDPPPPEKSQGQNRRWIWITLLGALAVGAAVLVGVFWWPVNSKCQILSPTNGAVVGPRGNVTGTGCPAGLNHYLIVEPVDASGQRWAWGKVPSGPWTKNGVDFGRADTPSGMQFRIYVLSTTSELPKDEVKDEPENPKQSPPVTVTLIKPVARNNSPPRVRISDTNKLRFQSGVAVMPGGLVTGTTSDPQSNVFLLMRVVRACWGPFDCIDYTPDEANWHVAEMSVDAQGNWNGVPCAYPWHGSRGRSDFQYWELIAVALDDATELRRVLVPETCAVSEDRLVDLPAINCSETVIVLNGHPEGYTIHYERAPRPRRYCFGREFLAKGNTSSIRISDMSDVHMEKHGDDAGGTTVERLEGIARGVISPSQASVFVLWRAARRCYHRASRESGGVKGASIPVCDERDTPEDLWNAREAAVDAAGNWSATIGPIDETFGKDRPWVEFWQFQAVATFEHQRFAEKITPSGALSVNSVREISHLLCSEPRIFSYSEVFSGFWRGFEPTEVSGFCK